MDQYHQFSDVAVKEHYIHVVDGKNVFFSFLFFKASQREATAAVTISQFTASLVTVASNNNLNSILKLLRPFSVFLVLM